MRNQGIDARVKIYDIVKSQLPQFIREDSPKVEKFLEQYYISQEHQGGATDIAENLDQYLKLDNLIPETVAVDTTLTNSINSTDTTITVGSTKGYPSKYGLFKIDNEIISYESKTDTSFVNCFRGFSAISSYTEDGEIIFSSSDANSHDADTSIQNLSALFLKEFYKELKYSIAPGFEDKNFVSDLNVGNFLKEVNSFYKSKGTEESYRMLFNVLYGETPSIVNLEQFLLKSSSAEFIRREEVIVQSIFEGQSIQSLLGQTIIKESDSNTTASVAGVESFYISGKTFYKLSLFVGYNEFSAIEGNFTTTPSTISIESISDINNQSTAFNLVVDSTIGFGKSGSFFVGSDKIDYTDKSINQFINCTTTSTAPISINSGDLIRNNEIYFGYGNNDTNNKIYFRILSILSDKVVYSDATEVIPNEIMSLKTIGEYLSEDDNTFRGVFSNSWIYNTSVRYKTTKGNKFNLLNAPKRSSLKLGDNISFFKLGEKTPLNTGSWYIDTIAGNTLTGEGSITDPDNYTGHFQVRRKINKPYSSNIAIENGGNLVSDVQNCYFDNDGYAYIASNSLPSAEVDGKTYKFRKNIDSVLYKVIANQKSNLEKSDPSADNYDTIVLNPDILFFDGDAVFYDYPEDESPLQGLVRGIYYIKKENNKIKLYSSRSFIEMTGNKQVTFNIPEGVSPTSNDIGNHTFTLFYQKETEIGGQKLLKKFPLENNIVDNGTIKTSNGGVGMLINGVEIGSYKSNDYIYYGKINSFDLLNSGENYDVINPPQLSINTSAGQDFEIRPVMRGSVIAAFPPVQNFDISEIKSAEVVGGNGSGAKLQPILELRRREMLFKAFASTIQGGVNVTANTITFIDQHNLSTGDSILYDSKGYSSAGQSIQISVDGSGFSIPDNTKFYVSITNASTIKLHYTKEDALTNSNPISIYSVSVGTHAFKVSNPRNTVSNILVLDGGENYTNRKIKLNSNNFNQEGNYVEYKNHGFSEKDVVQVVNLTSFANTKFLVSVIDKDKFRLSDAGNLSELDYDNYENQIFADFDSSNTSGSNIEIKYPDIEIFIKYIQSNKQTSIQSMSVTPIVRGEIIDAYIDNNGSGYGSTILNYKKSLFVDIDTGSEASLSPIIENGRILDVEIGYGGLNYYSTPTIKVIDSTGQGVGAILVPIITNNTISSVRILNSGIGYDPKNTRIVVESAGSNCVIQLTPQRWTLDKTKRTEDGTQNLTYESAFSDVGSNKLKYSVLGLSTNLKEVLDGSNNDVLSGIIGWAYDGNPIYGPIGEFDPIRVSGDITKGFLKSGYSLIENVVNDANRPSGFEAGSFIEDYEYIGNGDLDEHNGRFEVNGDFPNGRYVYHATMSDASSPSFPYFIGNTYKSTPITEKLDQSLEFDTNRQLSRSTFPYLLTNNDNVEYEFLEIDEVFGQEIRVESVTNSDIDKYSVISPGDNYKVNDKVNFTPINDSSLDAFVSEIEGKTISNVSTTVQEYQNSQLQWVDEQKVRVHVGVSSYHQLDTGDLVYLDDTNLSTFGLSGFYKIDVNKQNCIGLTTFTQVGAGETEVVVSNIPPSVSIGNSVSIQNQDGVNNSYYEITEIIEDQKVLRLKGGVANHNKFSKIEYLPSYFDISKKLEYFNSEPTKLFYFDENSIGIGTIGSTTKSFNATSDQITITREIPKQAIYIENHGLKTGQKVTYNEEDNGISIEYKTDPDSSSVTDLQNGDLYVVNKGKNHIGLRTSFDGEDLFFTSVTSGNYSIRTTNELSLIDARKVTTTVTTTEDHGLQVGDTVKVDLEPNLSLGIGNSSSVSIGGTLPQNHGFVCRKIELVDNDIDNNINVTSHTITINDHGLSTGDKIVINATANAIPSLSITSTSDYKPFYVVRIDDNVFKLAESYPKSIKVPAETLNITKTYSSPATITFSVMSPQITVVKGNNLVFDISDHSTYDLKLFTDNTFTNNFVSTGKTSTILYTNSANSGISTLKYDKSLPNVLYYNMVDSSDNIVEYDTSINNYNSIVFADSKYNGKYKVNKVTANTFEYTLKEVPERTTYSSTDTSTLKYTTESKNVSGPIAKVKTYFSSDLFESIPQFKSITSQNGTGGFIMPSSNQIGKIQKVNVSNNNFRYPHDYTLSAIVNISPKIELTNSNTITSIGVSNGGTGYTEPPVLKIFDDNSNQIIDSGSLIPIIQSGNISSVSILEKPNGIPKSNVRLVSTQNDNGIRILGIVYYPAGVQVDSVTYYWAIRVSKRQDTATPNWFDVGDKLFIEGVINSSVGNVVGGNGFNSEDHNFSTFTVKSIDSGSSNTSDYFLDWNSPALTPEGVGSIVTLYPLSVFAQVIRNNDLPIFNIVPEVSKFNIGEELLVNGENKNIRVTYFDGTTIKVLGSYDLRANDVIFGRVSKSSGTISKITSKYATLDRNYSNSTESGWTNDIGKLNSDVQVLPDNHYYQNMSYAVKTNQTYNEYESNVKGLVHTIGMKDFVSTNVQQDSGSVGIGSTNVMTITKDIIEDVRVDVIRDFDIAKDLVEIGVDADSSEEIILSTVNLTDFSKAIGNRALVVDDISDSFSSKDLGTRDYVVIKNLNNTAPNYYNNLLIKVQNKLSDQIQLHDLTVAKKGTNDFVIIENSMVSNADVPSEPNSLPLNSTYADYEFVTSEYDSELVQLRFIPKDENKNTQQYDIKVLNSYFVNTSSGTDVQTLGKNKIQSDVIENSSSSSQVFCTINHTVHDSLYMNVIVTDLGSDEINIVDLYVHTDGTVDNTFISESITDSSDGFVSNILGSFDATIDDDNLQITFNKNSNVSSYNIRSKTIAFPAYNTMPTTVEQGNYYFTNSYLDSLSTSSTPKSDRLEQTVLNNSYTVKSTINANIVYVGDAPSSKYNSLKATVKVVKEGATESENRLAIHQVLVVVDDSNDVYTRSEQVFIANDNPDGDVSETTSGVFNSIGSFEGTIDSGTGNLTLKFIPNETGTYGFSFYGNYLHKDIDNINDILSNEYGTSPNVSLKEDIDVFSFSTEDVFEFDFKYKGSPIFYKTFNPGGTVTIGDSQVNVIDGNLFTVPDHLLRTGQEVIYSSGSSVVGGQSSDLGNFTSASGNSYFIAKINENQFKVCSTLTNSVETANGVQDHGISATIPANVGNSHVFEVKEKDSKCIVVIDDIIQQPLVYSGVESDTTIASNGVTFTSSSEIIELVQVNDTRISDILQIDVNGDGTLYEYVRVDKINRGKYESGAITITNDISDTNIFVTVTRGLFGSTASNLSSSSKVKVYRGSFKLNKDKIYFTEAPRGTFRDGTNKDESNYFLPKSTFSARVFLRSESDTNTSNRIFDDISKDFDGKTSDFGLQYEGDVTSVGIGTTANSGIVVINGLFQTPKTENNPSIISTNFEIEERDDSLAENAFDITGDVAATSNQITNVSGNTVEPGDFIDNDGTDTHIPVGTKVIAVNGQTLTLSQSTTNSSTLTGNTFRIIKSPGLTVLKFTGARNYSDTNVLVIADEDVNQNELPRGGVIVDYSTSSGYAIAPLIPAKIAVTQNGGSINQFYGTPSEAGESTINVTGAEYNETTGNLTITASNHGFTANNPDIMVKLAGLGFTCEYEGGPTYTVIQYPEVGDTSVFPIRSTTTSTITVNVGISTRKHTWNGGGTIQPWYHDLTTGSGYFGDVTAKIVDMDGNNEETITLPVDNQGGIIDVSSITLPSSTGWSKPVLEIPQPSYSNLPVEIISRIGDPNVSTSSPLVGIGMSVTVSVNAESDRNSGLSTNYYSAESIEIIKKGYAFQVGDVLRPVGIVTAVESNTDYPLEYPTIAVDKTFSDSFAAWEFGEFDYIDSISEYQDGFRVQFPLSYNGNRFSFEKDIDNIDFDALLLIFINGVPQVSGLNYVFEGGANILFTEAPNKNDDVDIFFYTGVRSLDTETATGVKPTLKVGDELQLSGSGNIDEQKLRTMRILASSRSIKTNLYRQQGISILQRPLHWYKQKEDTKMFDVDISKSRLTLSSNIVPVASVIGKVSTASTEIYVINGDLFDVENNTSASDPYSGIGDDLGTFDCLLVRDGKYTDTDDTNRSNGNHVFTRTDTTFTASANQTDFTVSYTVGLVDVFLNGTKLSESEYTATNGTSVVLATGASVGDVVVVAVYVNNTDPNIEIIKGFTQSVTYSIDIKNPTVNASNNEIEFFTDTAVNVNDGLVVGQPIYVYGFDIDVTGPNNTPSTNTSTDGTNPHTTVTNTLNNIYYVKLITSDHSFKVYMTGTIPDGSYTGTGKLTYTRLDNGTTENIQRSSRPIALNFGITKDGEWELPTLIRRTGGHLNSGGVHTGSADPII